MKKSLLLFLFIGITLGSQIGTIPIKNKFIKHKIKSKISIEYPKNKISSKINGKSLAEYYIDEKGNVYDIRVINSLGSEFDNAIIKAVKEFKYKPAMINNKAIKIKYRLPVHFKSY